jgi:hypothetical protein
MVPNSSSMSRNRVAKESFQRMDTDDEELGADSDRDDPAATERNCMSQTL